MKAREIAADEAARAHPATRACQAGRTPDEFGRALQAMRLAVGMTRAELATTAGIAPSAVARLERGAVTPTVATLARLADVLGLTFEIAPRVGLIVQAAGPRAGLGGGAPTLAQLRARREQILQIAATHGARNVRVFGSIARGQARPDSDVDLLVELEPGRTVLDLSGLILDLEEILGRQVDVVESRPPTASAAAVRIEQEAVPL